MNLTAGQGLTLLFVGLVSILGGASAAGVLGNIILQLAGAALIASILWNETLGLAPLSRSGLIFVGAGFLALLQFVPLPPVLWQSFPGRESIAAGFKLAGMDPPWLAWSLDPWGSLQSLVWLVPALAVFIAMRSAKAPSTRLTIYLIAAIGYLSVVIAGVQYFTGTWYFYAITNFGNGVGLFANSNHLATYLLITMALVSGQWVHDHPIATRGNNLRQQLLPIAGLLTPLALGVVMTNSLAGLVLLPIVLAGILLLVWPTARISWLAVGTVAIIGTVGLGWLLQSGLLENDLLQKSGTAGISRGEFAANGMKMLQDFAPFGSGIGTFRDIYPWYENPAQVGGTFVNHAHNDLLEFLIETGLIGLMVLGLFLRWFIPASWQIWNTQRAVNPVAFAATLSMAVTLAHSLGDYPLRTAAVSCLFALCCALMGRVPEPASHLADKNSGAGKRESLIDI